MSAEPIVSVIIASYNSIDTIEATLASLEGQAARERCEIIVVDSSTDGTANFIKEHFPGIRVLEFSGRKFPGDARNEGIRVSRGRIIAMTDADCSAAPLWLENIIRAHEAEHPVVGGAIACGNPESYVGWGAYFSEFSHWQPSGPPRFVADMAGANISYKRELFDDHGAFIKGAYCSDTEFHWRLAGEGHRIHFDPSVLVYHRNIDRLGRFLSHEFFHGKSFALMRCRAKAFSPARRSFYALLSPLIFLKLFARNAAQSVLFGAYTVSYLKALPVTMLGIACWTSGEAAGYVQGTS